MSNFGDVPEDFRARTAFFEAAANSTLDGILVVDANRKMILQNQRMVELFGIPQEIAEDQDDRKRVKWVTDLVKYPEPFIEKVKYLYSHPDETSRDEIELRDGRFLDRYSSPVIGGDGEYYGRIWAFRDITELKQNETSLKLFRALVDHSSDAIHVVDPDTGRFIDVNERTLRDLGYTVDEMRALTVFDVAVGLDRAAFDAIKSRSKEMGGATGEFPLRRKDGSTFLIEVSLSTVTLERDYLVASVRDITERKEAESQVLLQSAALEAVANGIVITNGNGLIQWTNHSFTHLTGYTTAEVIGRNPNILKSGKQDTAFYAKLWETIRFGKVWKGELVNRRKDGTFYA